MSEILKEIAEEFMRDPWATIKTLFVIFLTLGFGVFIIIFAASLDV